MELNDALVVPHSTAKLSPRLPAFLRSAPDRLPAVTPENSGDPGMPLRRVACVRPPDPAFADPRLAALYDGLDGDRSDLDAYAAIADELKASRVIDIGCGTGSLAVRLAALGMDVVGVDPAEASLDVARGKAHAQRVTWVHGDATALPGRHLAADLAVMTGNVAQVFVDDDEWASTLDAIRACLRPNGWFVFETRLPQVRDWEGWDLPPTVFTVPGGPQVVVSRTVTKVEPPLVTFVSTTEVSGAAIRSASTLRFRERHEVEQDLQDHGFEVVDVRDAPDRPGKELVFLARVTGTGVEVEPVRRKLAEVSLGLVSSDTLADWACDVLVAGLDTPALRELAGLPVAEAREAKDLLYAVAEDLDLELPNAQESRRLLVQLWATDIVSGDLAPEVGAFRIWAQWSEGRSCGENVPDSWLPFVHEASDWDEWPRRHEEIRASIRSAATRLSDK